jgi:tRNA-Thr(GGU) m(6)t(6)A37 methyltransferase TsaA
MVNLEPIGFVKHNYPDEEVRKSSRGVEAEVIVKEEYTEGLKGIEEFSHIILISFLNKSSSFKLKVKPKRLMTLGLREEEIPEVGVFTTDSPSRPNPIGLSTVKLIWVKGNILKVENCDLYNETPILDIKGFYPHRCPEHYMLPEWALKESKGYLLR